MAESLFTIECPTCLARLRVRRLEAIGAIWPCPRCGSLVQVTPPPGWQPPASTGSRSDSPDGQHFAESPLEESPKAGPSLEKHAAQTAETGAPERPTPSGGSAESPRAETGEKPAEPSVLSSSGVEESATITTTNEGASGRRRWIAVVALLVLAACITGISLRFLVPRRAGPVEPAPVPQEEREPATAEQIQEAKPVPPGQWILEAAGEDITEVFGMDDKVPPADALLQFLQVPLELEAYRTFAADCQRAMGLKTESLATHLVFGKWRQPYACIFELASDQQVDSLNQFGQELTRYADITLRRLPDSARNLVFAVLDSHTLLVGDVDFLDRILRQHATTEKSEKKSQHPLANVLNDARHFQVFFLGQSHSVCSVFGAKWLAGFPQAFGLLQTLQQKSDTFFAGWALSGDQNRLTVRLSCRRKEDAASLHDQLEKLRLQALEEVKSAEKEENLLAKTAPAGMTPEGWSHTITAVKSFLEHSTVVAEEATVAIEWSSDQQSGSIQNVATTGEAFAQLWHALATTQAFLHAETLGGSLSRYAERQTSFPRAAIGGDLLPPETRLSWISEILPHLGYAEWSKSLQPGYSWNAPQNQPVTKRFLPEVTNPLLGATQRIAGYYDAHIVGVTGVGPDSGNLPLSSPRAGLFNFRQAVRKEDVKDGLSNTLALLPAENHLGPWAAGGTATARGLTKPPYVKGPDGFGSALPDGMLAVMADGSVRFIRRDVDSHVMEQLATIAGGEAINLETVAPAWPGKPLSSQPSVQPQPGAGHESSPRTVQHWPGETPCGQNFPPRGDAANTSIAGLKVQVQIESWPGIPLALALARLTEWSSIPICVDPETLLWDNPSDLGTVALQPGKKTIQQILEEIAGQHDWTVVSCGNLVVLCRPERVSNNVSCHITDPSALVSDKLLQAIITTLDSTFGPSDSGIKYQSNNNERIFQGPFIHVLTIRNFLEQRFPPQSLSEAAAENSALQQIISMNYYEPTPLVDILAALNRLTQVQILVDWPLLLSEEVHPSVPVTCSAHEKPFFKVVQRLAETINATVYILNDKTLLITTHNRFDRPYLRAYPLREVLQQGLTVGALRERVVKECQPQTWYEQGGIGRIFFTEDGQTAIVYQDATAQNEVQRFLQRLSKGSQ
ncbi:DUF1559 domain-containing protein [Thermogutta terrifontis]|uniref:DUF1559 family PulG-like putative transporter n=1 Tax=Thermogutta terrifontis TaxID=1331910 RepID=UPI0012FD31EC|nr:DUF1559 domain-containing protein [Thermogutta terrifontis]